MDSKLAYSNAAQLELYPELDTICKQLFLKTDCHLLKILVMEAGGTLLLRDRQEVKDDFLYQSGFQVRQFVSETLTRRTRSP